METTQNCPTHAELIESLDRGVESFNNKARIAFVNVNGTKGYFATQAELMERYRVQNIPLRSKIQRAKVTLSLCKDSCYIMLQAHNPRIQSIMTLFLEDRLVAYNAYRQRALIQSKKGQSAPMSRRDYFYKTAQLRESFGEPEYQSTILRFLGDLPDGDYKVSCSRPYRKIQQA